MTAQSTYPTKPSADPRTPAPKGVMAAIIVISMVACAAILVIVYGKSHGEVPAWVAALPWVNAGMNATSAALLTLGVRAVKRGQLETHRNLMLGAFAASSVFLVSYLTYHWLHGDTKYLGPMRGGYLFILASHILLSVVALPMVLATFYLSLSGRIAIHRKLARFTFPIWLYVSITGVVIVLMLKLLGS